MKTEPVRAVTLPARFANREAFRIRDLTDSFGFSKSWLHAQIKSGRLEAVTIDGCVLLPRAAVERLLASARVK